MRSSLKPIITLAVLLALCSTAAAAQTPQRDALIDRIGTAYMQSSLVPADSPIITLFIDAAKAANPKVKNEDWEVIKREVTTTISGILMEKGGPMDYAIHKSLEVFSIDELLRLQELLEDPLYKKLQTALANPATQLEMAQVLFQSGLKINNALNGILAKHGLNTIN